MTARWPYLDLQQQIREEVKGMKRILLSLALIIMAISVTLGGCGNSGAGSGDPDYEARTIFIEGIHKGDDGESTIEAISIAELRELPQHELDASFKRTTGMVEEYAMKGPYLRDIINLFGVDLSDFAGMGVMGSDGYYCLLSREVIDATPDLMLALVVDGAAKLEDDKAPAWLAVQGQFGPYWVKMVEKIILYDQIPDKDINSIWVFSALAEGIEPFEYEYYGSKDASIELGQIFSRLDKVDNRAFFTMKSADGFKKDEAINIVKSRYYIKVEGEDAPTNISPYIKLGMNVHNISWISTNEDAAIFPEKLLEYMDVVEMGGKKGIPLSELLYETEVEKLKGETFDILGVDGEKLTVPGEDLFKGILVSDGKGGAGVYWDADTNHENIEKLLRIRRHKEPSVPDEEVEIIENEEPDTDDDITRPQIGSSKKNADTILSVTGDGLREDIFFSLKDLKELMNLSSQKAYIEQIFSVTNNWPTKKYQVAKGVDLTVLLKVAGIKDSAKLFEIAASDGYYVHLTKEQLLGERFYYPGLADGNSTGSIVVKPVLAWAWENDTKDISKAKEGDLRLMIGQQGLNDVNTAPSVQKVISIAVSSDDPGKWAPPAVAVKDGHLVFSHDHMDQVKLHYTLDGSMPDYNSPVYNPSTSYFQPQLIKPIPVSGSGKLRVKAIGYGKNDSEVIEFDY